MTVQRRSASWFLPRAGSTASPAEALSFEKGRGVPEAEWAEVLQLQGKAPRAAMSIAEQLMSGKGIIKP